MLRFPLQLLVFCVLFAPNIAKADTAPSHQNLHQTKIGAILPLSGPFARYGDQIKRGLLDAKPDSVSYIFEDEGCNPTKAVSAYKKLSSFEGVRLFLGPWCGSPQSALAPSLRKDKTFAMLGSSAPEAVFAMSGGRMFSTQPSIESESRFNAKEFNARGLKSVVIIFFENQFSRAHEIAFRSEFKGKVLETLGYTNEDASQLKSLALKVKQLNPDSLYIPDAFPLMAGLLRQLRLNGVPKLPIFSVYSAQSEDVLEVVKQDGEGLIYSYYDIGEADALDFFPLRAGILLQKAVEKCGSDADCVKKTMPQLAEFDETGTLSSGLIHKHIQNGQFQVLQKFPK